MKRLVVCCDGTWNTPDETKGGKPCPTNVTKLALAVAEEDQSGVSQHLYYHRGVGTSRDERFTGGAFGYGLSRDVRSAYRFIVDTYVPGDELFFFGFSRGAFTARSTAGFLRNVGVLRPENSHRLDEAYALYRDRATGPHDVESELFRRSYSYETSSFSTRIRFIGVWDTVGALGIPWSGVRLVNRINRRSSFHDTTLSRSVDAAFQALAIDEQRKPFEPAVWQQHPEAQGQRIEQVWFPGVHGDVGGGYADAALADVTLLWMAARAREYGLALREGAFTSGGGWGVGDSSLPNVTANPLGPLHKSRKGFYRLARPFVRTLGTADPDHEFVSDTAAQRGPSYASAGLSKYLAGPHQAMAVSRDVKSQV